MKEKEVKRIANSVQRVWLMRNPGSEWEVRFSVSYQKEPEVLTSYYDGDAVRSWKDLNAALKTVEKLFPKVKTVNLILDSGVKNESQSEEVP